MYRFFGAQKMLSLAKQTHSVRLQDLSEIEAAAVELIVRLDGMNQCYTAGALAGAAGRMGTIGGRKSLIGDSRCSRRVVTGS